MFKKTAILITVCALCSTASAAKTLERSEIVRIFRILTSTQAKTWIQAGTINAIHTEYRAPKNTDANEINNEIAQQIQQYTANPLKRELTEQLRQMRIQATPFNVTYKLSNEYTMKSAVTVTYDGDRFHWQIDVDQRTDSIKPEASLADNFLTDNFKLFCNQSRIFAWNGQNYIEYIRPINHAIITQQRWPVNGPLTAAVIPWGRGNYTYEKLIVAQTSATQTQSNGQTEINLTITNDAGQETFTLDPTRNYVVTFYSQIKPEGTTKIHQYTDYQLIAGSWCPGNIIMESYDTTGKLRASDTWQFNSITADTPTDESFSVQFDHDALIEDYFLGPDEKPLQYRLSSDTPLAQKVNFEELIKYRRDILTAQRSYNQNCATAALKYVCDKLGSNQPLRNLSKIVHGRQKTTTLYQTQQYAQNAGLHALAVRTDIQTLKNLTGYHAILHLPRTNHLVVLGEINAESITLIDLTEDNFYYTRPIECFNSAWDGIALLIADKPITTQPAWAMIDTATTKNLKASGQACTNLLQSASTSPCILVDGVCTSGYTVVYERYGCETAPCGTCSMSSMTKSKESDCEHDIDDPTECITVGDWTYSYMSACS